MLQNPPKMRLAVGGTLGHAEKHLTSVIDAKITIFVASVAYLKACNSVVCCQSYFFYFFGSFFVQRMWSLFFYAFPPGGVSASHI